MRTGVGTSTRLGAGVSGIGRLMAGLPQQTERIVAGVRQGGEQRQIKRQKIFLVF